MKKWIFFLIVLGTANVRAYGAEAKALIRPTQEGSTLEGTARFEEKPEGLKITIDIQNASPGNHAFHIHSNGSCEDQGKVAGPHFNPDGTPHGFVPADGLSGAHAGDFGNIRAGEDGKGHLELTVPGLAIHEGKYAVGGKAVVVHEKVDSFEQPDGKAGARIGCGVIRAE